MSRTPVKVGGGDNSVAGVQSDFATTLSSRGRRVIVGSRLCDLFGEGKTLCCGGGRFVSSCGRCVTVREC